jgi:hypothetical protein
MATPGLEEYVLFDFSSFAACQQDKKVLAEPFDAQDKPRSGIAKQKQILSFRESAGLHRSP